MVACTIALLLAAHAASMWVVLPPLCAAALVLVSAALSVDYFGLRRRRVVWVAAAADPRAAWRRARALSARFGELRAEGSPRTAATARALLVALAECDRLADAREVVELLEADAPCRVGGDPTADALGAVALAELGRAAEARRRADALWARHRGALPGLVAWAVGRVAELGGRAADGLRAVDAALTGSLLDPDERRGLLTLRAKLLVRLARVDEGAEALRTLALSGWRRDVERVAESARERGDAATALAAARALAAASPYR
jgi:hypothetical protein